MPEVSVKGDVDEDDNLGVVLPSEYVRSVLDSLAASLCKGDVPLGRLRAKKGKLNRLDRVGKGAESGLSGCPSSTTEFSLDIMMPCPECCSLAAKGVLISFGLNGGDKGSS